jgi:hypothetical protein
MARPDFLAKSCECLLSIDGIAEVFLKKLKSED